MLPSLTSYPNAKTLCLAAAVALVSTLASAEPIKDSTPVIPIDGQDTGRIFDGIGALSAGASSRLLIDYPEPQRSEILDYLFKPKFGAALHINKVEIGGDMNSTCGSEPTHMRKATEENYQRGYEWWLMVESKKRNPNVKLSGLAWGTPNWINSETTSDPSIKRKPWTKQFMTYLLKWVQGAKTVHNLDIDSLGGWNESGYDVEWSKQFRLALNQAGFSRLKMVCDDGGPGWAVAKDIKSDPEFAKSFDIVGVHYPAPEPRPHDKERWKICYDSGKPLWGSEVGSKDYHKGAANLAKLYNQGYIGSRMTCQINWSTIWSALPSLPFQGTGLMQANEPWSGHYEVGLSIWATAHTTQFTQPGWQYLDGACAYLGGAASNGSVVALRSPDKRDFTLIAETLDAKEPRTAAFEIKGGLPNSPLHLWKTKMNSQADADWFVQQEDITAVDGRFTVKLEPGCLYTVSTVSGHKGVNTPPPSGFLPLPYKDDFQAYEMGRSPKYLSDMHGAFEIASAGGGRTGKCLRQMVAGKPVWWTSDRDPATIVGNGLWRNYTVSADVLLEQPGYVEIAGRATGGVGKSWHQNAIFGYFLRLNEQGHWSLRVVDEYEPYFNKMPPKERELAAGDLPMAAGTGKWRKLSLSFLGSQITASIDGEVLGQPVKDETYAQGLVALVTGRWNTSQFMNLAVVPNGDQPYSWIPGGLRRIGAKVIGVDSQDEDHAAASAIDGDPDTFWHSAWRPKPAPFPHFLALDLGQSGKFNGIRILPRQNHSACRIAECEIYVSETPDLWGAPVAMAKLENTGESQTVRFKAPASGRYLKLLTKSSQQGNPNTAIAELEVIQ